MRQEICTFSFLIFAMMMGAMMTGEDYYKVPPESFVAIGGACDDK
jgi:hypothetical protein